MWMVGAQSWAGKRGGSHHSMCMQSSFSLLNDEQEQAWQPPSST